MKVTFAARDTGQVSLQGNRVDYSFDPATRQLRISAHKAWWNFITSCAEINQRISEFLRDCRCRQVTRLPNQGNLERWRIDRPNVKQAETAYPEIELRTGDRVRIDAGGCAQTGGEGPTWRLYVDPKGPASANYYKGLIRLPGMERAAVSIREFVSGGNNHQVRANGPLHLGYADEPGQYANNGYWGKDDGIDRQCRRVEAAWVVIGIYRTNK